MGNDLALFDRRLTARPEVLAKTHGPGPSLTVRWRAGLYVPVEIHI
jgi:hypothetical protein